MRIEVIDPLRLTDAHHVEHLNHPRFGRCRAAFVVDAPGFGDLLANAEHRIQRVFWVLHDHRNALAANAAHLSRAGVEQIELPEAHRLRCDAGFGRMQL